MHFWMFQEFQLDFEIIWIPETCRGHICYFWECYWALFLFKFIKKNIWSMYFYFLGVIYSPHLKSFTIKPNPVASKVTRPCWKCSILSNYSFWRNASQMLVMWITCDLHICIYLRIFIRNIFFCNKVDV